MSRKLIYETISKAFADLAALEVVTAPPPVVVEPEPPVVTPPAQSGSLVVGQDNAAIASLPRPTRDAPQVDPAYKRTILAATDKADGGGKWVRNDYSRRQAFNADESRYIGVALDGFWYLYDASTRKPITRLQYLAGSCEPIWHPTEPSQIYFHATNGGMTLQRLTVSADGKTQSVVTVADFRGKLPWSDAARCWMKDEGACSADGRYWCFQAETSSFAIRGAFVYDLVAGKVLGTKSLTQRPDHVSMSPSGRYAVLSGDGTEGTAAYDRDTFALKRKLLHKSEHSDLGLLWNGQDFYIAIDYQSAGGDVFVVNIDTGDRKVLFSTYGGSTTAIHFSAKAFKRPGLVAVSTYATSGTKKWFHDKVFLLDIASGKVGNLCHHRNRATGYYSEPHASISPSGRRVLFNSNWGGTDADHGAFLVELNDADLEQMK